MEFKSICVFCGSGTGNRPVYRAEARNLGALLAKKNITLIFGGGKVGIMGVIADSMLAAGGACIGVMPENIASLEIAHDHLSELHIVETMPERKNLMATLSDAFIAFPGGFGTLDELSEILTFNQLRISDKPVGILNVNGYFDHLMRFIRHGAEEGFIREEHAKNLIIADHPEELLSRMTNYRPVSMEPWIRDIRKQGCPSG
ncbi:MAG: TIGR00730 family Rossman fold protein [Bacteroidales bacterium]|nr:TIGR00730 family Rossman fold protein [Bacteroidales bacterium]